MKAVVEDTWGNLGRICDTARISASDRRVEGNELSQKDFDLIEDLLLGQHGTPFETLYFRIRMEVPIFVIRQLVKHRMMSMNEMSRRYRGKPTPFYVPDIEGTTVNGVQVMDESMLEVYVESLEEMQMLREDLLREMYARIESKRNAGEIPPDTKDGRDPWRARARELVRGMQPVSEYTEVIITINFRSLMNMFNLRLSEHAQYETRKVVEMIYEDVKERFPFLVELFDQYNEAMQRTMGTLLEEAADRKAARAEGEI